VDSVRNYLDSGTNATYHAGLCPVNSYMVLSEKVKISTEGGGGSFTLRQIGNGWYGHEVLLSFLLAGTFGKNSNL
jgi:hypothetical protein